MNQRKLGRGYQWWDKRWEKGQRVTPGDYFVFVEESGSVTSDGLLGPADIPIHADIAGARPWRFHCSGVAVGKFLAAAPSVDPLGPDAIDFQSRRRRRAQLSDAFGHVSMPLLDILVAEDNLELPFLRSSLRPGSWSWIGVRRRGPGDGRLPVFIGSPEAGPDDLSPGSLQFLEAVPPYFEYRLRDIFSLVHVSDFGDEGVPSGADGGGDEPPDPHISAGKFEQNARGRKRVSDPAPGKRGH